METITDNKQDTSKERKREYPSYKDVSKVHTIRVHEDIQKQKKPLFVAIVLLSVLLIACSAFIYHLVMERPLLVIDKNGNPFQFVKVDAIRHKSEIQRFLHGTLETLLSYNKETYVPQRERLKPLVTKQFHTVTYEQDQQNGSTASIINRSADALNELNYFVIEQIKQEGNSYYVDFNGLTTLHVGGDVYPSKFRLRAQLLIVNRLWKKNPFGLMLADTNPLSGPIKKAMTDTLNATR